MPRVSFEDTLPYAAQALQDLVMEIDKYPRIFPDIRQARVRPGNGTEKHVDVVVAGPLFQSLRYSCAVDGSRPGQIDIRATGGDFKSMSAQWRFTNLPDGRTRVQYSMDFDFGGFGLKNTLAKELIDGNVGQMRDALRRYAAGLLAAAPANQNTTQPLAGGAQGGPTWGK